MRKAILGAMILAALLPLPAAAAEWREITRTPLAPNSEMFIRRFNVAAPVEHLQLRAEGGDAHCLTVRAGFRDGDTRVIFHGAIPQDAPVILPFEGGDSSIRQLRLRCSGSEGSELAILADVGRFGGEWAGDSILERAWATARNWSSDLVNGWQYVGAERFTSRYAENRIEGPEQPVAALALRPVGRDARCRNGAVLFEDGRSRALDLDRNDFLAHDQYYRLELPVAASLEAVELECRATNGARVLIQVFAAS
jgi:hypothetical protein